MDNVLDRFVRYARIDTQSDEHYEYDFENHLVRVARGNSSVEDNVFDYQGSRVIRRDVNNGASHIDVEFTQNKIVTVNTPATADVVPGISGCAGYFKGNRDDLHFYLTDNPVHLIDLARYLIGVLSEMSPVLNVYTYGCHFLGCGAPASCQSVAQPVSTAWRGMQ